jgi:cell division protein FtsW
VTPKISPWSRVRQNQTFLGKWLWTIDLGAIVLILALIGLGSLSLMTASPAVAQAYHYPSFFFVERHFIFLLPALTLLLGTAMLTPTQLQRFMSILFIMSLSASIIACFWGPQIKGARRWIPLPGGINLQPSEFLKPALIFCNAWLLSREQLPQHLSSYLKTSLLCLISILPIILQPDLGMTLLIGFSWGVQLFVYGLPIRWFLSALFAGLLLLCGGYLLFPHVQKRIHSFLFPQPSERYGEQFQIFQSLEAYEGGGLWGKGLGRGSLKTVLPDAHTDFIFPVLAEELGILLCIALLGLYAAILTKFLLRSRTLQDTFISLAVVGLIANLSGQILINLGSTLALIPAKGMTFPLLSYGGSSLLSTCLTFGLLLSLTRSYQKIPPPLPKVPWNL